MEAWHHSLCLSFSLSPIQYLFNNAHHIFDSLFQLYPYFMINHFLKVSLEGPWLGYQMLCGVDSHCNREDAIYGCSSWRQTTHGTSTLQSHDCVLFQRNAYVWCLRGGVQVEVCPSRCQLVRGERGGGQAEGYYLLLAVYSWQSDSSGGVNNLVWPQIATDRPLSFSLTSPFHT